MNTLYLLKETVYDMQIWFVLAPYGMEWVFFLWLLWMVKPEENLLSDIILPANVSALWRTKGDKGDKNSHQTK